MTTPIDLPRLFALTRLCDQTDQVVGYGMVLPDGSAHSISWPSRTGATYYSADSAEQTADLRGAKLLWLGDPL
jgi:hypothetical protein